MKSRRVVGRSGGSSDTAERGSECVAVESSALRSASLAAKTSTTSVSIGRRTVWSSPTTATRTVPS
jgi:hypothetical protein